MVANIRDQNLKTRKGLFGLLLTSEVLVPSELSLLILSIDGTMCGRKCVMEQSCSPLNDQEVEQIGRDRSPNILFKIMP